MLTRRRTEPLGQGKGMTYWLEKAEAEMRELG